MVVPFIAKHPMIMEIVNRIENIYSKFYKLSGIDDTFYHPFENSPSVFWRIDNRNELMKLMTLDPEVKLNIVENPNKCDILAAVIYPGEEVTAEDIFAENSTFFDREDLFKISFSFNPEVLMFPYSFVEEKGEDFFKKMLLAFNLYKINTTDITNIFNEYKNGIPSEEEYSKIKKTLELDPAENVVSMTQTFGKDNSLVMSYFVKFNREETVTQENSKPLMGLAFSSDDQICYVQTYSDMTASRAVLEYLIPEVNDLFKF